MERLRFLEPREVQLLAARFGTPLFVYDLGTIKSAYEYFRSMPNEYGLTVRYSVKANPNRTILRLFDRLGAAFDASSVWEASRVIKAGVDFIESYLLAKRLPKDGSSYLQGVWSSMQGHSSS